MSASFSAFPDVPGLGPYVPCTEPSLFWICYLSGHGSSQGWLAWQLISEESPTIHPLCTLWEHCSLSARINLGKGYLYPHFTV